MKSGLRAAAVLLAAGQGSRMGHVPKALLRLKGVFIVQRHLNALLEAGITDVVVVTGFYHEQVEPVVQAFPVKTVRNPEPEAGQPGSVRLGLEALGDRFDAVLMMLCDQPLIDAQDIRALLDEYQQNSSGRIIVPRVGRQRGNPVVFSGKVISEILAQGKDMYCRKYMDDHPELVVFFDTNNQHYVLDVDTVSDLRGFEQAWGLKLELPDQSEPIQRP